MENLTGSKSNLKGSTMKNITTYSEQLSSCIITRSYEMHYKSILSYTYDASACTGNDSVEHLLLGCKIRALTSVNISKKNIKS